MIRAPYKGLAMKAEAQKLFAVKPPRAVNVIPVPKNSADHGKW
jgi:hypothetical protein